MRTEQVSCQEIELQMRYLLRGDGEVKRSSKEAALPTEEVWFRMRKSGMA